MEKIIELWKEYQKSPKKCTCWCKDVPNTDADVNIQLCAHEPSCPMGNAVNTDVGMFLEWLSNK